MFEIHSIKAYIYIQFVQYREPFGLP